MSEIDGLVLQTLERLEDKITTQDERIRLLFKEQNEVILQNTLGYRRMLEKTEARVAIVERDSQWHTKWIAGTSGGLATICGILASWLWYHVTR
jgi:hypothetical protein